MSRCTVNGKPVKSLYLQFRGGPAFLVSEDTGTYEITRFYYAPSQLTKKPVFKAGYSDDRVGGGIIESADHTTTEGLTIHFKGGTTLFVHTQWISGNWSE